MNENLLFTTNSIPIHESEAWLEMEWDEDSLFVDIVKDSSLSHPQKAKRFSRFILISVTKPELYVEGISFLLHFTQQQFVKKGNN